MLVMGIVNVTPDSFSDGGQHTLRRQAVSHALRLVEEGAEILDVGGESTRPGAQPVPVEEELRRVVPVIEQLRSRTKAWLSVDTMKPEVARAALTAGAAIVNDVAANRQTPAMWEAVAEFRAGYICMHAGGGGGPIRPADLHRPVKLRGGGGTQLTRFFKERLNALQRYGVKPEQVVLDPGIGFGKTLEQNLRLLAGLPEFHRLGRPLLLGVSRKSFIEKLLGANLKERLPASLSCATLAVADGVQIIRTHDVAETVQAVRMAEAIINRKQRA